MTGEYPDHQTYKELYRKYYGGRDVGELLGLLGPLHDMRLLDLCTGEGQLTLKAFEKGVREAVVVDRERRMISLAILSHEKVWGVHVESVHHVLVDFCARGESFDRVACRQGVNYWLNKETARMVADVMAPGGVFAFNTFNRKPSEKPRVLQYELEGHSFVEVSWLVGDIVHHLQAREGMVPHQTSFRWFSPESLREMLKPYFVVIEIRHEKTSLYRCEKR